MPTYEDQLAAVISSVTDRPGSRGTRLGSPRQPHQAAEVAGPARADRGARRHASRRRTTRASRTKRCCSWRATTVSSPKAWRPTRKTSRGRWSRTSSAKGAAINQIAESVGARGQRPRRGGGQGPQRLPGNRARQRCPRHGEHGARPRNVAGRVCPSRARRSAGGARRCRQRRDAHRDGGDGHRQQHVGRRSDRGVRGRRAEHGRRRGHGARRRGDRAQGRRGRPRDHGQRHGLARRARQARRARRASRSPRSPAS